MQLQVGRPVNVESLILEMVSDTELRCIGTLQTETARAEFSRHLGEIHAQVVARAVRVFTVDLRKLSFVNSSAVRLFVTWIARAEGAAYKLVFKIDRGITWHRLSFSVLQSLAPKNVDILDNPDQDALDPGGRA